MKKILTLPMMFVGVLILLAPNTGNAQQQVASLVRGDGARTLKTARANARAAEELRFSMSAFQKRKEVLKKYLATVAPNSTDYQVTQRSIADLDGKVQEMARALVGLEFPSLPAPSEERPKAVGSALRAAAPNAAEPQDQGLKVTAESNDAESATIIVDATNYRHTRIKVEATDSKGITVWSNDYPLARDIMKFSVPNIRLAPSGETTITVSSPDGTVSESVKVSAATAEAPPIKAPGRNPGLIGLLLAGSVISQQAESTSQADPFMGFIVGYDDMDKEGEDPKWRLHWRVQGIFQTQPKKEEAPVEGTGDGEPDEGEGDDNPTEDEPADFRSFIASRKSFDVEMSAWIDRAAKRFLFFGGKCPKEKPKCQNFDPNVRIGFYGAVGGTAYVDKNELKGDEAVKVEDTENDADSDADGTGDQVELDTERAKIDNDIDHFYEFGLIGNFFTGAHEGKPKLFMQAKIGYGRYEALAGFNPGKTGFLNDSRNRFIGKLRVFPMFLDRNPEGTADASPMFGVDINAGRGPDQIKFFTGIATAFKLAGLKFN